LPENHAVALISRQPRDAGWSALSRGKWIEFAIRQRLDEERVVLKSEILAMRSGVHSIAKIWNSGSLDQALGYARHMKEKHKLSLTG